MNYPFNLNTIQSRDITNEHELSVLLDEMRKAIAYLVHDNDILHKENAHLKMSMTPYIRSTTPTWGSTSTVTSRSYAPSHKYVSAQDSGVNTTCMDDLLFPTENK